MPLPNRKNVILTRDRKRKSDWENLIFTNDPPRVILENPEKKELSEAVMTVGSLVNSLFAEEKLIDEIIVTISPKIFGYGLSLFSQKISMELELKDVHRLGKELVCLTYRITK
ncbi:MAG: dihydrofolate reductase family protein [Desulfococcaceae bacterium]